MSKYCEITVKNHKKYNRKIVFLIFNDCSIEDSEEVDKIATEYHKIVKENPSISSIIDARNIISIGNRMFLFFPSNILN